MIVFRGIAAVLSLMLLLVGSASAQSKPAVATKPAAGKATIYLMRPMPLAGFATAPSVGLDGRAIGDIAFGTYYALSVSPGNHTISIQGAMDGGREHDLQVQAGKSYFIEVGPLHPSTPGHQLMRVLITGTQGQQMAGRGFLGAYTLYLLGPEIGRAKLASLRKVSR